MMQELLVITNQNQTKGSWLHRMGCPVHHHCLDIAVPQGLCLDKHLRQGGLGLHKLKTPILPCLASLASLLMRMKSTWQQAPFQVVLACACLKADWLLRDPVRPVTTYVGFERLVKANVQRLYSLVHPPGITTGTVLILNSGCLMC